MPRRADVVLVIGSDNSSNSNRLVEVSRALGTRAHLIDDEAEIDRPGSRTRRRSALPAGPAPEGLVDRVIGTCATWGPREVDEVRVAEEHLVLGLLPGVRETDERRLATAGR